jgi:hypothetical protein
MELRVGSYASVHHCADKPIATDPPERIVRGRKIATVQPFVQDVPGDAKTAEDSFLKINANPATIDPTDLDIIRARKKPNAIATRALMQSGKPYYKDLDRADEIGALAREVHGIIFGQLSELSTKSPDIPRAGQPYSGDAFEMVLDMVNIFNDVTDAMWKEQKKGKKRSSVAHLENDIDGSMAIQFLKKVKEVGVLIADNGENYSGSLGLDQAVYSYGITGRFHPTAFIASMKFADDLKKNNQVFEFTEIRNHFEEFLVRHKMFINQLGHSKGGRLRPLGAMLDLFTTLRKSLEEGILEDAKIIDRLKVLPSLKALNDVTNIPETKTRRKSFSKTVQNAATVRSILENRERCNECGARLPPAFRSKDHKDRKEEGGTGSLDNLCFTHPYCNTGFKEAKVARERKRNQVLEPTVRDPSSG